MLRRRRAILTGDTPLSMEGHAAPGSMATDQSDSASSSSLPAAEAEPAPIARQARLTVAPFDRAGGSRHRQRMLHVYSTAAQALRHTDSHMD